MKKKYKLKGEKYMAEMDTNANTLMADIRVRGSIEVGKKVSGLALGLNKTH